METALCATIVQGVPVRGSQQTEARSYLGNGTVVVYLYESQGHDADIRPTSGHRLQER